MGTTIIVSITSAGCVTCHRSMLPSDLFTYVKSQSLRCIHTYLSNIKHAPLGLGRSLGTQSISEMEGYICSMKPSGIVGLMKVKPCPVWQEIASINKLQAIHSPFWYNISTDPEKKAGGPKSLSKSLRTHVGWYIVVMTWPFFLHGVAPVEADQ